MATAAAATVVSSVASGAREALSVEATLGGAAEKTAAAASEAAQRTAMQNVPTPMVCRPCDSEEQVLVPPKEGKRQGYLNWEDYFMGVAFLTSMRSKDPSTQVGACIVNGENRIVGVGYNGFPSGIEDDELPWGRSSPDGELETKYPYVCHAELNAVMNKNVESCKGCRIFSTLFPCSECAKVIIQAGIKKVVYASDKHAHLTTVKASKRLFTLAGVEMVQHSPEAGELRVPLCYPPSTRAPEPQEGSTGYSSRAYEKQVDGGSFSVDAVPSEGVPPAKRAREAEK
eukprot:TRINITY_DN106192_c0_g1_i1.p1 TRINITY_DN106192_c0_g1~~TRINITY_DN106192_c0_g1_i1.p1  ORF type:complete len:286 (+),score=80.52 TRINITY_DN106192_c0_g1_i1:58-915(+)